jgi:hypothetical protein
MNDLRLHLSGELRVEYLVGMLAEGGRRGNPAQEVSATLPTPVEELRLVDQWRAVAHCAGGRSRRVLERRARMRVVCAREIDVPSTLRT